MHRRSATRVFRLIVAVPTREHNGRPKFWQTFTFGDLRETTCINSVLALIATYCKHTLSVKHESVVNATLAWRGNPTRATCCSPRSLRSQAPITISLRLGMVSVYILTTIILGPVLQKPKSAVLCTAQHTAQVSGACSQAGLPK